MPKRMSKLVLTDAQIYLIAFVIGLIAGVIIFQIKSDVIYPAMSLYQELRTDKLKRSAVISLDLLRYVVVERFKEFGVLFLTQITIFHRLAACIYCIICGISCAVLEAFYVRKYSLFGMAVFAATLLPHYIFYVMAWYKLCSGFSSRDFSSGHINRSMAAYMVKIIALTTVCLFIGIICESMFNIWILKKFF